MPLTSTRPDTARAAKSLPRAILSFGSRVLVASIAAFCILLLAIRYVVFPQLESHRGQISDLLAQQIGQPVELGALASGWDGWNPRLDVKDFRVVDRQSGATLLSLPALHLTLAWTSLLFVDLRFKELALERPESTVHVTQRLSGKAAAGVARIDQPSGRVVVPEEDGASHESSPTLASARWTSQRGNPTTFG